MTGALIVIAVFCALGGFAAALFARRASRSLDALRRELAAQVLLQSIGHRVVVHTKDSQSIKGVLVRVYKDCLALDRPEYLVGGSTRDVGGDGLIPIANFAWLQRFELAEAR